MKYQEVNFDGLIGPTHNYGGLSFGNIASKVNSNTASSPRAAALQGLKKMKFVMDQGLVQGVLPPHLRPDVPFLRSLGYEGRPRDIIQEVGRSNQLLLNQCSSASSMWVANAATVTSSLDSLDHKVHLTPANLISHQHRSLEPSFNFSLFKKIFKDEEYFSIEKHLPCQHDFSDEGAANFIRLSPNHSTSGMNIFVYGRSTVRAFEGNYPARQTLEAFEAISRKNKVNTDNQFFVQQSEQAINAGVFHNDVISVGNENVLFYHELAFADENTIDQLSKNYQKKYGEDLILVGVKNSELSLQDAVESYLFNSQLLTLHTGEMLLLAPYECNNKLVSPIIDRVIKANNPIKKVAYFQLNESMRNGGGPACLRLRVLLNEDELKSIHQGVLLSDSLYVELVGWVNRHYRDRLLPKDLLSPDLYDESYRALEELSRILAFDEPVYGAH